VLWAILGACGAIAALVCLLVAGLCWRRKKSRGFIIPWNGVLGYRKSYDDIANMDLVTASQLKIN
jgi:hypothetical protein